jgi:sensor histidine kinase regulating citrate/malate metabolism
MDRERVIWGRPSPEERRQQLVSDLRRISGFLSVVVGEARHLRLPVPANAQEIIASLDAWEQQLTPASKSR